MILRSREYIQNNLIKNSIKNMATDNPNQKVRELIIAIRDAEKEGSVTNVMVAQVLEELANYLSGKRELLQQVIDNPELAASSQAVKKFIESLMEESLSDSTNKIPTSAAVKKALANFKSGPEVEQVISESTEKVPSSKAVSDAIKGTIVSEIGELSNLRNELTRDKTIFAFKDVSGAGVGQGYTVTLDKTIPAGTSINLIKGSGTNYLYYDVVIIGGEKSEIILSIRNGTIQKGLWGEFNAPFDIEKFRVESYKDNPCSASYIVKETIIGDLSELETTNKQNLVTAINETVDISNNALADVNSLFKDKKVYDIYDKNGDGITPIYFDCQIKAGTPCFAEKMSGVAYTYIHINLYDNEMKLICALINMTSGKITSGGWDIPVIPDRDVVHIGINSYRGVTASVYHLERVFRYATDTTNSNRWGGKKWLMLGDSISTEGGAYAKVGYGTLISNSLGMVMQNKAVSGVQMYYFYDKIDSYDTDFDLITIMLGTNNQGFNNVIGGIDDEGYKAGVWNNQASFIAQGQLLYEKLRKRYPEAIIAFITPIRRTEGGVGFLDYKTNGLHLTTEPYAVAVEKICRHYAVPYIDIYNTIDPRFEEVRKRYFVNSEGNDGTHPNDLGHARFIAPVIEAELKKIAPFK